MFKEGEAITFNPEAFVQSRPISMQPFLQNILHLQIFQQVLYKLLHAEKKVLTGSMAQSVVHLTADPGVASSNPSSAT